MREAKVEVNGELTTPVMDLPDLDPRMRELAMADDPALTQMVVPVEWLEARTLEEAVKHTGLFSSPVTVCKLRDDHTIETLEAAFGLTNE